MSSVPVIVTEEVLDELTRPIIGIEYRSGEEAHAIMSDRIRSAFKSGRIAATSTLQDQVEAYREALEAEDAYWAASRACAAAFARIRPQAEDNLAAAMARRNKARAALTQKDISDAE